MTDLLMKFAAAVECVASENQPYRDTVPKAYWNHLRDINPKELPEELAIIYEAVSDRLNSILPTGDIGNDEAGYIFEDILFMNKVVKSYSAHKSESPTS